MSKKKGKPLKPVERVIFTEEDIARANERAKKRSKLVHDLLNAKRAGDA